MRIQSKRALLLALIIGSSATAMVVACVGDDPTGTLVYPDASTSDVVTNDAVADTGTSGNTGTCTPDQPFKSSVQLDGLPAGGGSAAWLMDDELTMYFVNNDDIYLGHRSTATGGLIDSQKLTELDTASKEHDPRVFNNQLYFATDSLDGGALISNLDLVHVDLSALGGFRQRIGDVDDSVANDYAPAFDGMGNLYFTSDRAGSRKHIYAATASPSGAGFGSPAQVMGIPSPVDDQYPVISADGLVMYWSSTRTDQQSTGGYDVFVATRKGLTGADAAFTGVRRITEISSLNADNPSWLSPDGCHLYYWRDTNPPAIYLASKR